MAAPPDAGLFGRVFYRCVLGSRAYGLDDDASDTDCRGVFLPTAEQHWSLAGVPPQIERHDTQEHYWELGRFLDLALKANPSVLECLHSPLVEHATPLGRELVALRPLFLTKRVYETFHGYAVSQFRKMAADLRNKGTIKPKHAMHLIRLLLAGIGVARTGTLDIHAGEHRDRLLAIKRGEMPAAEREAWRLELHAEFDRAYAACTLPDAPDEERANAFLIRARRLALDGSLP